MSWFWRLSMWALRIRCWVRGHDWNGWIVGLPILQDETGYRRWYRTCVNCLQVEGRWGP